MSVSPQADVENIHVDPTRTASKRKSRMKSMPKPSPTESLLRNTADVKVCKSCRKPEAPNGQQKDREARLLNVIRHQISKNLLDPYLESSLLLDAPELLQEIAKSTGKAEGSHIDVPATSTKQQVPEKWVLLRRQWNPRYGVQCNGKRGHS